MNAMQCKLGRTALGLGVRELAALAKVSTQTIARLERGEELKERTLRDIQSALEARGIQFLKSGEVATGQGMAIIDSK